MTALRFGMPVIVSPTGAAPYAARYGQPSQRGLVFVRSPERGLHEVDPSTVKPRTLGLGDDKAVRHAGSRS